MATNEIAAAARAICEEKGIALEAVIEAIESALAAAYRKDYGEKNQNIKVEFDLETANSKIYDEKTVVEDMPEQDEEEDDDDSGGDDKSKVDDKKKGQVKSLKLKVKSTTTDDEKKETKETERRGNASPLREAVDDEKEEEVRKFNPRTEIELSDAKEIKKSYKVGDVIKTDLKTPEDYGRMAAQTAKQVIIQRIREVERTNMFDEFKDKEHEVVTGIVQRREGRVILVDLGRTNGILIAEGQVAGEHYETGQRIKVYVEEVRSGAKGPEIILSRTSVEVVRKIFLSEIPEITNGLVEIKSVSREAGSRSKIAVYAAEENVDPIGSCVGQRGARISTIISELGGEKIDIIEYSENPNEYIANALSPAKVTSVEINEENHIATANVPVDQLSLAIGKGGQNVRLAARLTGWKIDVKEAKSKKDDSDENKTEESKESGDDEDIQVKSQKLKVESTTTTNDDDDGAKSETEKLETTETTNDEQETKEKSKKAKVKKDTGEKEEDEKETKKKVKKESKKDDEKTVKDKKSKK